MKFNWKSIGAAVASALTMLAALPYTLGDVATIIPPSWKPYVATVGIIAGFLLRSWNAKQPQQPPKQP